MKQNLIKLTATIGTIAVTTLSSNEAQASPRIAEKVDSSSVFKTVLNSNSEVWTGEINIQYVVTPPMTGQRRRPSGSNRSGKAIARTPNRNQSRSGKATARTPNRSQSRSRKAIPRTQNRDGHSYRNGYDHGRSYRHSHTRSYRRPTRFYSTINFGYPFYRYGRYSYGRYGYPYWLRNHHPYYLNQPNYYYDGPIYEPTGAIRLKVKPREAEVFVDGYYVGLVNEFDGVFQRLRLEPGPKQLKIRSPGFRTLIVEVRIIAGRTVTYEARMQAGDPGPEPRPEPPAAVHESTPPKNLSGLPMSGKAPQRHGLNYKTPPTTLGGILLKVAPSAARIFVDGYYVGIVNDFDGSRGLILESGPKTIKIQSDGYKDLVIEVRILPGETITYEGELIRMLP